MPRSGEETRTRILDQAEALIYAHGFSATTVDKVIDGAGITKGAFFYHFSNKAALGRAILERFADGDLSHLDRTLRRAEGLTADPVQQVLVFVGLLREDLEQLTEPVPGCLFASYLYQRLEAPGEAEAIANRTLGAWRDAVAVKLDAAFGARGLDGREEGRRWAEALLCAIEGGYVIAKAMGDAGIPARQVERFRDCLEDLFESARDTPASVETRFA